MVSVKLEFSCAMHERCNMHREDEGLSLSANYPTILKQVDQPTLGFLTFFFLPSHPSLLANGSLSVFALLPVVKLVVMLA